MMINPRPTQHSQQGALMIEAMVAILIFSMGVLAVAGLQASMLKNTSEAKFRSDANYIAQKRIGEIWAHPGDAAYLGGPFNVSSELPGGQLSVNASGVQYTITVSWQQPGEKRHSLVTVAHIDGNS